VRKSRLSAAVTLAAVALVSAACGSDDGGSDSEGPIEFWSTMIEPERIAIQREIISNFTEETGVEVKLVPVAEDELPNLMVSNAASGTLPDVVQHSLDFAIGWAEEGLLDTAAAAEVVDTLGPDTFNPRALELVTVDEQPVTVPSDGWGQLLIYRRDLFEQEGLEPPDSYDRIVAAAEALHDPANDMSGITASTDPADVFTQQTFEHFALANGCELVQDDSVTLDAPECVDAISTYQLLIEQFSPGAVQNVDSTRATYFAGEAAMVIWSPFILDEMAGLRNDALPTCPECEDDPLFLVENSGMVPAFSGSGGEASQYGVISYFGIGAETNTDAAKRFVEFLLSDGYVDWLSIGPEGQFPMRTGTADDPERFENEWRDLEIGVDKKERMSDVYGDDVIDALVAGTQDFDRWGFEAGYGSLVSSVYESLVVPQTLSEVVNGDLSPEEAAGQLQSEAQAQFEDVGGGGD
jgi:multiple sugar transport system substrate-binding protein